MGQIGGEVAAIARSHGHLCDQVRQLAWAGLRGEGLVDGGDDCGGGCRVGSFAADVTGAPVAERLTVRGAGVDEPK